MQSRKPVITALRTDWRKAVRCLALGLLLCGAGFRAVATAEGPLPIQDLFDDPNVETAQLEVTYDQFEYFLDENLLILAGHVNLIYKDVSISADEIDVDLDLKQAEARGNVILWRAGQQWSGNYLIYNYESGSIGFSESAVDGQWVFVKAPLIEIQDQGKRIIARDAQVTTCDMVEPHYYFKVSKTVIEPNHRFWLYNGVLKVGDIPVGYFPYFSRSLAPEDPTYIFSAGHSKKKGAIFLNKLNWTFNDYLHLRLFTDYFSEIGPGLGVRNRYAAKDPDQLDGFIYGYYLFGDNNDYMQEPPEEAIEVDDERWKIAGEHWQKLTERTTLTARYQFLSDQEFNDDFDEQELLHGFASQGNDLLDDERNSFVNLAHRGDHYNYRITAKARGHDVFYNEFPEEERLPQVRIDGLRRRLLGTPLYFKTGAEFTRFQLEQQIFKGVNTWELSQEADRAEFDFELSWPLSLPAGLRLIPSAGYQLTHYSNSVREFEYNDRDGSGADNDGKLREEFDDLTRHVGVAGVELVDRLVVGWDTPGSSTYEKMRLVTEPRIGFFYREPSVDFEDEDPEEIVNELAFAESRIPFLRDGFLARPFDERDLPRRTEKQLRFNLETKFEGKTPGGTANRFLRHSFEVAYDFEPEHDHWTDLVSDLWFHPHSRVWFDSFLQYDLDEDELRRSNTALTVQPWDRFRAKVGVATYDEGGDFDEQEDLYVNLWYRLSDKYYIEYEHRRDLDESETRENRLAITRDMHDLLATLVLKEKGFDDEEHEFEIQAVVILKFPGTGKTYGLKGPS